MTKSQVGAAIFLIAAHMASWISQVEWWPISNYPMYARPFNPPSISTYEFTGLTKQQTEESFVVPKFLFPFWSASLLEAIDAHPTENRAELFKDLFLLYKSRRQNRFSDWPDYIGLRVYRVEYDRELYIQKIQTNSKMPEAKKTLIWEAKNP